MVRKKMEGDERQRRKAAHHARRAGDTPSAQQVTTGASKQRAHVRDGRSLSHEERTTPLHRGKQRHQFPELTEAEPRPPDPADVEPSFPEDGRPRYTAEHERVFRAVADAERRHGGEGVYLEEVSRRASLPPERTRTLLHELVTDHRLVTELQRTDAPDQGPRFETKPRL